MKENCYHKGALVIELKNSNLSITRTSAISTLSPVHYLPPSGERRNCSISSGVYSTSLVTMFDFYKNIIVIFDTAGNGGSTTLMKLNAYTK